MAADDLQDIDLASLDDAELTEQMHNDLYDGMAAEIVEGTNILLGRGWSATRVGSCYGVPQYGTVPYSGTIEPSR